MANVGAGVFQGMPVSTSLSASSLNESAGAQHAGRVADHRRARARDAGRARAASSRTCRRRCSAAMIIDAVVFGMIDIAELRRLYRVTRFDFWIAVAAIVGVLSAGVLAGVVDRRRRSRSAGSSTSRRRPPMPLLGREPGTQVFRDLVENPDDETFPGIAVAPARRRPLLRDRRGARGPRPRARATTTRAVAALVLDLEGVNFIDSQGAAKLTEIHELAEAPRASRCGSRASSRRCARCSRRTASSTGSAPTTSTATSTARSKQTWPPSYGEGCSFRLVGPPGTPPARRAREVGQYELPWPETHVRTRGCDPVNYVVTNCTRRTHREGWATLPSTCSGTRRGLRLALRIRQRGRAPR